MQVAKAEVKLDAERGTVVVTSHIFMNAAIATTLREADAFLKVEGERVTVTTVLGAAAPDVIASDPSA